MFENLTNLTRDDIWNGIKQCFFGAIIILAFVGMVYGVYQASQETLRDLAQQRATISRMGNSPEDVEIFLRGSDFKMQDFINSPSLQKQYNRFKEGDDVSFIENNRSNRQIRNARRQASSAQAISTVALVHSMSRS